MNMKYEGEKQNPKVEQISLPKPKLSKPKKPKTFLFWLKSNRGTNERMIVELPGDLCKSDIKSHLENWCSKYGAWTHSDNVINYGYKSIKVLPRKELEKKWHEICARRQRVEDQWKIFSAMFNVRKIGV